MKKELFAVDTFLKRYSKEIAKIETSHISDWIGCSGRYVQRYAQKSNVQFHHINGRKHYIWSESSILDFAKWYNSKRQKVKVEPKKRAIRKQKETIKKVPKEKPIPFKTIKDIVKENEKLHLSVRLLQIWAKKNHAPYKFLYGRKYYIMTDELVELYKQNRIDQKEQNRKAKKKRTVKINEKSLSILRTIANEQK